MSSPTKNSPIEEDDDIWIRSPFDQPQPLNLQLQSFEQSSLQCHICHSFYRNAVSLKPCNHCFCSECVRKALRDGRMNMKRTRSCPICREEIKLEDDKAIIPNWGLQAAVDKYKEMRSLLYNSVLDLQQCQRINHDGNASTDSNPTSSPKKHPSSAVEEEEPSSKRRRVKRKCTISKENVDNGNAEKAENHIECNVVDVPTSTSIPSTSDQIVPDVPASWRRQRPKPHYHGMKKKKLQELCKVEGLSTSGGEKELKERHTLYLTLWNSECDARVPRKRKVLLQEISKRETAKKKEYRNSLMSGTSNHTSCMDVLKRNREAIGKESSTGNSNTSSSTGSVLTSGNTAFDSMFNQGFKDLIANYKNRNNKGVRKRNETTTWSGGSTQTLSSSSATERNELIASPPISKGKACATSTSQFSSSNLDKSPKETSSPEKSPMDVLTTSHATVAFLSTEANSSVTNRTSVNVNLRESLERPPVCMSSRTLTENSRLSNGTKQPATKSLSPSAPVERPRISRPLIRLAPQKKAKRWCCSSCTFINTHSAWSKTKSRCKMCDSEWEEKMDIIPQSNGTSKSNYIEIDS